MNGIRRIVSLTHYEKTKAGKYMTEAQAKAAGAHPEQGKGCGK